jgi:hypothetical protein
MKTQIAIVALLSVFNINASADKVSGSLDVSHTSDYYFRGSELGTNSLQASVGANTSVNGVDLFANVFTNQTTASGSANTDILTVGGGKSFADGLLSLYTGVVNVDHDGSDSVLDAFISVKLDTALSPAVTVYRNTDDELYTVEGSVSYTIKSEIADLRLSVEAGTTDVTSSTNRDYAGATAKLSRTYGAVTPHLCLSVVDADDSARDTIVRAGLTFKF